MQPEFSPVQRPSGQEAGGASFNYEVPSSFASPEQFPSASPEQYEQRSPIELAPQPPMQPAQAMPPVVVAPLPDPVVTPDPSVQMAVNPDAASDDDMIEKEWVDRAKQVISQTRDNPRAREQAIGELQRDYLMKRYGKQLGATND